MKFKGGQNKEKMAAQGKVPGRGEWKKYFKKQLRSSYANVTLESISGETESEDYATIYDQNKYLKDVVLKMWDFAEASMECNPKILDGCTFIKNDRFAKEQYDNLLLQLAEENLALKAENKELKTTVENLNKEKKCQSEELQSSKKNYQEKSNEREEKFVLLTPPLVAEQCNAKTNVDLSKKVEGMKMQDIVCVDCQQKYQGQEITSSYKKVIAEKTAEGARELLENENEALKRSCEKLLKEVKAEKLKLKKLKQNLCKVKDKLKQVREEADKEIKRRRRAVKKYRKIHKIYYRKSEGKSILEKKVDAVSNVCSFLYKNIGSQKYGLEETKERKRTLGKKLKNERKISKWLLHQCKKMKKHAKICHIKLNLERKAKDVHCGKEVELQLEIKDLKEKYETAEEENSQLKMKIKRNVELEEMLDDRERKLIEIKRKMTIEKEMFLTNIGILRKRLEVEDYFYTYVPENMGNVAENSSENPEAIQVLNVSFKQKRKKKFCWRRFLCSTI